MNTEQIRELVLRKHNTNGGFTNQEAAQVLDFIAKTYDEPTAEELKLHDRIEVLFPDLWFQATGDKNRKKKPVASFIEDEGSVMKPSPKLLVKLGSLVVHYEEWTSNTGHSLDKNAIDSLMNDEEVVQWFKQMKELGLLPVKR